MNKPKSNREEIRSNVLTIMLTNQQKEEIEKQSNKAGLTMSSWARMVLAEKINQK